LGKRPLDEYLNDLFDKSEKRKSRKDESNKHPKGDKSLKLYKKPLEDYMNELLSNSERLKPKGGNKG
jgi:hypothetical protein